MPLSRLLRITRKAVMLCGAVLLINTAMAEDITGAGSTFVYPILSKWSDTYNTQTGNKINYQSIG